MRLDLVVAIFVCYREVTNSDFYFRPQFYILIPAVCVLTNSNILFVGTQTMGNGEGKQKGDLPQQITFKSYNKSDIENPISEIIPLPLQTEPSP
jgi:hypothetical protein